MGILRTVVFRSLILGSLLLIGCSAQAFDYGPGRWGHPGYDRYDRWDRTRYSREEARRVCVDRALETGHHVASVRSVEGEGRGDYRVMLRLQRVRPLLTCDYDGQSGRAALRW